MGMCKNCCFTTNCMDYNRNSSYDIYPRWPSHSSNCLDQHNYMDRTSDSFYLHIHPTEIMARQKIMIKKRGFVGTLKMMVKMLLKKQIKFFFF